MKNLLNISEEEKNRILEMHTSATNKHYLNEQPTVGNTKPLISQQKSKYPEDDPIQKPFYDYVQTRWGHDEDPYASTDIDFDQNGNYKLCDGPCKAMIPGTDENTIIWDYKKGMVSGLKSFGIDPKPISIKSNFGQMKQWFDNTYGKHQ
jgi:hypothetical protein